MVRENSNNPNYKHGHSLSGKFSKLYNTWRGMKERCSNKNHIGFKNYGAKGITVCDDWLLFDNFLKWSEKSGYKNGLTIDRKDANKNYCPNNCDWVSKFKNTQKARRKLTQEQINNIIISLKNGVGYSELARKYNVTPQCIYYYKDKQMGWE